MHSVDHGRAARTAHWQSADAVCAIGRRRGPSAWSFLLAHRHCATREPNRPSLIDFMVKRNVGVWRLAEVTEMTSEAYHPLEATRTHVAGRQTTSRRR